MKNASLITRIARKTLEIEAEALRRLTESIGDPFVACVELISQSKGRLVVTGIGKTALVAKKIVATLNSTGSASLFLHAADAIHGDIGMVQPDDILLCISKSGETAEIKMLALLARQLGNPIIAMVTRPDCSLANMADQVLLTPLEREAGPNDLAPTTSTTLQMAMGDALAMSLLSLRGFNAEDFARFHPGGSLGKQLYLRVCDLYPANEKPAVGPQAGIREVLLEMTSKRLGATAVVEAGSRKLLGIITDGDLRRMLSAHQDVSDFKAQDIMTASPITVHKDTLAIRALDLLRTRNISQLVVTDELGDYEGFLHLHDLVREGLV